MIEDKYKKIHITYNYLNLPLQIEYKSGENNFIHFVYSATGEKLQKIVLDRVILVFIVRRELRVALVAGLDVVVLVELLHRVLCRLLTTCLARVADHLGLEVRADARVGALGGRRSERRKRERSGDGRDGSDEPDLHGVVILLVRTERFDGGEGRVFSSQVPGAILLHAGIVGNLAGEVGR